MKKNSNTSIYDQGNIYLLKRNNNNVESVETGRIVIAQLPSWSDLEKYTYATFF